ncbi:UDP-forming cellulose synthase catalytic subunit [Leptolyngbya sp. FACHB-711]|uniref:UDP-forming cellulose synthase catalytic subunit n=1 Tax=unclassified Leptolyngbya TaxID=2650499 RepID=UPI0016863DEA|nr:UDP-forming cellulose synthase catalytic subunit [Leptolyngbya sp. FACHB-711]MBD1852182.1 UDP-forming cellulose synthase catalytic subunit [Cyanobacteria bacterium FACHB-502]MBD2025014.1 UDP-forming cellulose synthase catalytic subunit [Leptolyngbya sp. FACHB-711]
MTHSPNFAAEAFINSRFPLLKRLFLNVPIAIDRLLPNAGKWTLFAIVIGLLIVSVPLIVTPLAPIQQGIIAAILIVIGWTIVQSEERQINRRVSEHLHLFLAWISVITTLRYLYYRSSYTLNLDGWLNATFSILLYAAELYAAGTLLISYFQTLRLRDRSPVDLSAFPEADWFTVDVYIPTYNEEVAIVRKTALAAMALDYPADKKRVYVLDDGRKFPERRLKLQRMCQELGCTLLTRDNNDHAKAGNINTALRRTAGELILILDCDHVPSRQFLKHTVGFFYQPNVSLVQTPHWFYNADPFERNLLTGGQVPVHNELFYKVIQKGNDFWNAAFFCGSAAVIRKQHLLEVGGIAVETVTEDCHTSLRLHDRGYRSVYYDKIMVAGLAPETFSAYVGQQVRWAQGMAQILRLENPLLNPRLNLSVPQRLCYFSACSHFFFGFPRLMYAFAPILYLLFGISLVRGLGLETLAYAMPHVVLGLYANYITNKTTRFSFWNEVFENAMAFHAGIVTFLALLNPRMGSFKVTDKSLQMTNRRHFDWRSSWVPLMVCGLLVLSLLVVPFWLIDYPAAKEAIVINAFWAFFSLTLLGAALLVGFEQPQVRRAHRLQRQLRSAVYCGEQLTCSGITLDVSEAGANLLLDRWTDLPDIVELELWGDFEARVSLSAHITRITPMPQDQVKVAVEFVDLSQAQADALVRVIYSDVAEWYAQERTIIDHPLSSFGFLLTGPLRALTDRHPAEKSTRFKSIQTLAQIYWSGQFYPAVATGVNSRSIRLELLPDAPIDSSLLQLNQPAVGLLLGSPNPEAQPIRLVAQVESVMCSDRAFNGAIDPSGNPATQCLQTPGLRLELTFPQQLDLQQQSKIRQLLRTV